MALAFQLLELVILPPLHIRIVASLTNVIIVLTSNLPLIVIVVVVLLLLVSPFSLLPPFLPSIIPTATLIIVVVLGEFA